MDRWEGFGYVVFASIVVPSLPFIVSLFGRDLRWKGVALGFGFATLFLVGFEWLMAACWIGAWIAAALAIRARRIREVRKR